MSQTPLDLAIRMLALTGSGVLTGGLAWGSFGVMPSLYLAPAAIAKEQFKFIFLKGKAAAQVVAGLTTLSYAALAYRSYAPQSEQERSSLYMAAAVFTISILPYTVTAMADVNGQLLGPDVLKTDTIKLLLGRWIGCNYVRSILTLIGGGLGLYATL